MPASDVRAIDYEAAHAIGAHVAEVHGLHNRYFKGTPSNIPITISAKMSAATVMAACSINFFRITGMLRP
ncbi:MAG: hypothetical protein P8Y71_30585 [Pseudolabrys sp.]